MGRPASPEITEALAAPKPRPRLQVDAIEITQAIQDVGHSVPLVGRKRTLVRVYLGVPSGALTVRGELRVSRTAQGPWTTLASLGVTSLDASRKGSTLAELRSRRDDIGYSLNFRLPSRFVGTGPLWLRLRRVRDAATGRLAQLTDPVGTKQVTFVGSPRLRLRVINLRYTTGTPPVTYAAATTDLDMLCSWLRRAYPVARVRFTSVTVDATAAWPFSSGQANAQVAAIRALDMASGGDRGTHYYGLVSDGGGFMRGSAAGIPGTPDPSVVASGPTGANSWGWDTDGSYGDWYGGHELGHTFGRLHPGFCGESNDDSNYPFSAGQLANNDDRFVGLDVGDSGLGLPLVALPGTAWHDVMTYCPAQWLSSYTYQAIRDRLLAESALFPEGADPAQPAEAVRAAAASSGDDPLVHVAAVVNLTDGSASIEHVTPLPGPAEAATPPVETRVVIRARAADRSAQEHPVEFKPDLCRLPGEDETGLVDAVLNVEPGTRSIEILVDGGVVATVEVGGALGTPERLRVRPVEPEAAAPESREITVAGSALSWAERPESAGGRNTHVVQASTDQGVTWTTLAVGIRRTTLEIDPSDFAGAGQVRFRVLTTNGLSYTDATTDDFAVEEL